TVIALVNTDSLITQAVLMLGWLGGWIYINGHWLKLDFFGPKRVQAAPPAGGPPSPAAVDLPVLAPAAVAPAEVAELATPAPKPPKPPRKKTNGAPKARAARQTKKP
ncbi:MAG TPA: hypothetical protein VF718_08450, partial [Allosphingosinicella sp.]